MLRTFAVGYMVAACNSTLAPEPPTNVDRDATSFDSAYSATLVGRDFTIPIGLHGGSVPGDSLAGLDELTVDDVALGSRHACLIHSGGTVRCWGDHSTGALGEHRECTPPMTEGGLPDCTLDGEDVPTLPRVRDIAAGKDISCATTEDDTVVCWGDRALAAGSRLTGDEPPVPITVDGAPLLAERMIIEHRTLCAIDLDARLWCWGESYGSAPELQPQLGVLDIAFGARHSCIIDADGLRCTGDNRNGQLGDVEHARRCRLDRPCVLEDNPIPIVASRVVVGERHTCVLRSDGGVVCFGSNEVGQIANPRAFLVGEPGLVLEGVQALDAGFAHTCALRDDGLTCWGDHGQVDPREGVTP
jgi:alpha-tubulin suppressor-like RCC1 family protein